MLTKYSSTVHPKAAKWAFGVIAVLAIGSWVLSRYTDSFIPHTLGLILLCVEAPISTMFYCKYIVDEEKDALIDRSDKDHPMKISSITCIEYYESKKGRICSLTVRGEDKRFMVILLSGKSAESIGAHLQRLVPEAEVKHNNNW